jgi:nitroreductase
MDVVEAITSRASVRAYLDRPLARDEVERLLDAARWSPSGVNTQPWRVEVVSGAAKQRLGDRLEAARRAGEAARPDYDYYPAEWSEPYRGRRKACGLALYGALDIGREDHERQMAAWCANYHFFGAPIGLLIFVDRKMGHGSWIDCGMFIQSILLTARSMGLGSCPQASLAEYPDLVREELSVGDDQLLLCGIALGHADPEAPVNQYRTDRIAVAELSRWHE